MIEPVETRHVRKALGLTQSQLAMTAGVSQSLVAKIESGKLDPSFSMMKKISAALESGRKTTEKKVSDIMHRGLVFVSSGNSIKIAIRKMRSHSISQLPVLSHGRPVGLITEANLLNALVENNAKTVREVMEEAPPVLPPSAGARIATELLRHYPLVLVADKCRIIGVVTKFDLISAI